jgi:hypothetical protein
MNTSDHFIYQEPFSYESLSFANSSTSPVPTDQHIVFYDSPVAPGETFNIVLEGDPVRNNALSLGDYDHTVVQLIDVAPMFDTTEVKMIQDAAQNGADITADILKRYVKRTMKYTFSALVPTGDTAITFRYGVPSGGLTKIGNVQLSRTVTYHVSIK